MKKIKLGWRKPEKKLELETGSIAVAEHKGDINYLRFVRFKQLAPQFWEKMDSPLFEAYMERFMNLHNQGKYAQSVLALQDYRLAISQLSKDNDAWGLCFALISYEEGETVDSVPNDVELKEKLRRMTDAGLNPEQIKEGVVNFMKTSPETFQDHLILLEVQNTMTATV
jgi:hypothetical protein